MITLTIGTSPRYRTRQAPVYRVTVPDGQLLGNFSQPLYEGARALLALGYPPDQLMTTRWAGKNYDNFQPRPIGLLAKWTVTEGDRMQLRRWAPYPVDMPAPSTGMG